MRDNLGMYADSLEDEKVYEFMRQVMANARKMARASNEGKVGFGAGWLMAV